MSYQRNMVKAGRGAYIKEYYSQKFHPPGATRRRRGRVSSASVRASNKRMAENRFKWKLNANFDVGDLLVSLSYGGGRNKTITWPEMQRDMTLFLRKLKYQSKRAGTELRYCWVPEVGKKGAKHFHLVLAGATAAMIRKAWRQGFSSVKVVGEPGDGRNVYDSIAEYLMKASDKTREVLGNENIKRYNCSRNLKEPPVQTKALLRAEMASEVRYVPKGYYLVPDTVKEYVNEFGFTVREYLCMRVE